MPDNAMVETISRRLFGEPGTKVYAVLDGASIPDLDLPQVLWEQEPEHVCLYRGELAPDLAATAPYLVHLERDADVTRWIIEKGWGNHWGIFAITSTDAEMKAMRKHFRTFLMVMSPENKPLYFRYYDPRVFGVYLPTCNAEELRAVFGPIQAYVFEAENPSTALVFRQEGGETKRQEIALSAEGTTV
jgi:hypothetical protein